ncbi:MAG: D-alanyl-D-alanine carboxypeptidase/D-alanyl-D-alanine-endopeptidase [Bacteroidales bacterium]|jgi:D-alanyl-D-alanine carboxypeptidase/D-alanyl-D-alanine-endopeptidase (penicillin-binding protein 4)|nr:D-alanyl-D-alanine carboxypeptidase/D-alanyl-D-alanine-endopeptidase [Bacteroidales bacterium]
MKRAFAFTNYLKMNLLLLTLLLLISPTFAQTALQRFVNHPALKHASVGIAVTDLETGRRIVSHNGEQSLTPASVLKLITTATAIEAFGENYRYKTDVALDAGDPSRILVIGSGDPTLGSEAFDDHPSTFFTTVADALRESLPSDSAYSLYVVDNLFGYDGISPEWTWIDMGNYYAAGAYGISIFDNSYKLFFNTTAKNGCPRILRTEPEIKGLTFQNSLSLNSNGRDNGYIYGAPFSYERAVRGDIPAGRTEFSIKGDIPDPGLLLGETLAGYLKRAGLKVGKVETARTDYLSKYCSPERLGRYQVGKVLCTFVSRPMKEIIREVNVESNNHFAEHLIRSTGRKNRSDIYEDALEAGVTYVQDFWKSKDLTTASLQMHDGCGLAPQNAVSPRFLTDLLVYMYSKSDKSSDFFDSLPKAGEEGTLRTFLRDTRLSGKIAAKSGSIGGVQCYSGYLIDGRKKYAFTVMVNKFNGTRSEVRGAIEQYLLNL